jgi:glycosyltransferase involved in cell wall biosynthesis
MKRVRPVVLLLGPHLKALSGVSTHLSLLFGSRLAEEFALGHFQVGSEGRGAESGAKRLLRLLASPVMLGLAVLGRGASIVHVNTSMDRKAYWRDLAYVMAAKLCGARVLYQVHGGDLPHAFFAKSRLLTAFLRLTLRVPDVVVVLAREELDAYRKFVPEQRVVVIPNAIDCSPYARLERAPSQPSAPLKLLYIGRLHRDKGIYEALEGLRIAQLRGVRAHLVIAGSGPEERSLKLFAENQGLSDSVAFAGPVYGDGKLQLLAAADVFLLPSYREGLPYSLLESMAAGTPVITTRVGGIPDVVTDGANGILVPRRDPHAIARAIIQLASDRGLLERLGAACRRTIFGGYSIERQSSELSQLYWEMRTPGRLKALSRS